MFESAEVGNELTKEAYDAQVPRLREELLDAQYDMRDARFPMLLMVIGDDLHGCEEVIDLLNEWMDTRLIETEAFDRPSDEELERPPFWRYFRALAPRGKTSLWLGAWFLHAIADTIRGRADERQQQTRLEHMVRTERMLAADGMLILKFWLHLPKKEHKRRLKKARKDPQRRWQVHDGDSYLTEHYEEVTAVAERLLRSTNAVYAPWHVVESTDRRYRDVTVARTILQALRARLDSKPVAPEPVQPCIAAPGRGALSTVDLTATLSDEDYSTRLGDAQAKLFGLAQKARRKGLSSVLVFEGWDAAGKGGSIRRITGVLPARDYRVVQIAAPTDEEKAQHYLWRFWRHMPRAGRLLIFDRSWYGRVLVERIEGFAQPEEWARAYDEIVDFETQLVEHGILLLKFWLHIDAEEQLRRFQARQQTGHKRYKITDEDYRNREKWPAYEQAVDDLVARTSTDIGRWHLLPANDKKVARVQVVETFGAELKRRLR